MGIYTKTGDKGQTSLFDGTRIEKYSDRVNTYGTIDELNSFISLAQKTAQMDETKEILNRIQHKLFILSGEVATVNVEKLYKKSNIINEDDIMELEKIIDYYGERLPKVDSFVLPGKTLSGAQLHVARTVCRRAERQLIQLAGSETLREELVKYLNRLSDCLYILARAEDDKAYQKELVEKIIEKYQKAVGNPEKEDYYNLFSYAKELIKKATEKAEEIQVPVTIAIVDNSARLISLYRMEDALLVSLELAPKKAYTAVAMRDETKNLKNVSQPGSSLYQIETNSAGDIVTFAGGIPLYNDGKCIGGIGVSGGTVEEDQTIANYAVK